MFEIIKECFHWNARSFEDRRTPKDFLVDGNEIVGFHGSNITDALAARKRIEREDFNPLHLAVKSANPRPGWRPMIVKANDADENTCAYL